MSRTDARVVVELLVERRHSIQGTVGEVGVHEIDKPFDPLLLMVRQACKHDIVVRENMSTHLPNLQ